MGIFRSELALAGPTDASDLERAAHPAPALQACAHAVACPAEARHHCSDRYAEGFRRLRIRQLIDVHQKQCRSELWIKLGEGRSDVVTQCAVEDLLLRCH